MIGYIIGICLGIFIGFCWGRALYKRPSPRAELTAAMNNLRDEINRMAEENREKHGLE